MNSMIESLADRIRAFAAERFVDPARKTGMTEVSIRAGDVHRDMGLANRMPAVCGALRSRQFAADADAELKGTKGPHQGANAVFIFELTSESRGQVSLPIESQPIVNSQHSRPALQSALRPADKSVDSVAGRTVFLVSCVSKKRSQPAAACDLYVSDLFRKERTYIEDTGCQWFILSAEHGLVSPDQQIAPYDRTLNNMRISERQAWARRVLAQMSQRVLPADHIVIFAGARYREFLLDPLRQEVSRVEVPLEGLRIGEQLSWFARRAA